MKPEPIYKVKLNKEKNMNEELKPNLPLLGDLLPTVDVITTDGPMTLPADMSGKWFVLFSHPSDFTPVCTTEFVAFQERKADFDKLNCGLVGLSVDQVFSHIKWLEWIKEKMNVDITFPVIAANDSLAIKLGMLHPGKGTTTVRVVFIIDPTGVLRTMFYYPQEIGRNIEEILRTVHALQTSDKNMVAIPANWPNNSAFGDKVIVPPARTKKDAAARLKSGDFECLDWWMCTKSLK